MLLGSGGALALVRILAVGQDNAPDLGQAFEGLLEVALRVRPGIDVGGEIEKVEDFFKRGVQLIAKGTERILLTARDWNYSGFIHANWDANIRVGVPAPFGGCGPGLVVDAPVSHVTDTLACVNG